MRDALVAMVVARADAGVEVVYEGDDVDEAIRAIELRGCDCAILDLDLGDDRSPASTVADLVAAGAPVLVVSALARPAIVRACLSAGALGYVSKQSDADEIMSALQSTVEGSPFMSQEIASMLASEAYASVRLS